MDPLATTDDLASYLQRTDFDRASADLALAAASGAVRGYCRWPISLVEETLVADGRGTQIILLPTLRLVSVAEVRVDGVVVEPASYTDGSIDARGYTWSGNGQLRREIGWPAHFRAVEADVVHGHDPNPDEVRLVTLSIAARLFSNPDGLTAKTVGGISRSWAEPSPMLNAVECAVLDGHRLP